jgi:hypothetical protein
MSTCGKELAGASPNSERAIQFPESSFLLDTIEMLQIHGEPEHY